MLWWCSHLEDPHPVTGNGCVYIEGALFFVVPVLEPKCFKKDCVCPLSKPQKNKSPIKLLWCISQSIIFQDILVSFVLSQPRLLCQVVVRICREISKYFLSAPDTNISHLLISVIILIPNDNSFLNSPASMQEYNFKNQEILFCLKNMVQSSAFSFCPSFPNSCPKRIMGLILHLAIHNSLI